MPPLLVIGWNHEQRIRRSQKGLERAVVLSKTWNIYISKVGLRTGAVGRLPSAKTAGQVLRR